MPLRCFEPTPRLKPPPRRALALLALCAFTAGCGQKPGPASAPVEKGATLPAEWPKGVTEPLKITEQLTLVIPLEYERTALDPGRPQRALLSVQSDRSEARFDFFLPDFSGYTLWNYRNEDDPRKVEVVYLHAGDSHEGEPDAPGEYPPNMLKRALRDSLDPRGPKEQYGLTCYRTREPSDRLTCYGRRDRASGEDILLSAKVPPHADGDIFATLQARYYSKAYGGVRIAWRTHVSNLPRWHEIDAQIWKFIAAWNVAQAPGHAGPPAR